MKSQSFDPYADREEELTFEAGRRPMGRRQVRPGRRPAGRSPFRPPLPRRDRRWYPGGGGAILDLTIDDPDAAASSASSDASGNCSCPCSQPAEPEGEYDFEGEYGPEAAHRRGGLAAASGRWVRRGPVIVVDLERGGSFAGESEEEILDGELDIRGPAAASSISSATSGTVSRPCPQPAGTAKDRCSSPQPCRAIPDLRCVTQVAGIPFHYVAAVGRPNPATGLRAVTQRQQGRVQKMIPRATAALEAFVRNARSFGLPFDVILTMGSLYCRCSRVNGKPSTALSNHSYGDAIDIAGVRWASGGPASRVRETIVHNFQDREQRALLRRLNACLRLSFVTVIDYHRSDHQDHFHCDTHGPERNPNGPTTRRFVQEALGFVLGRTIKVTGQLDAATKKALLDYSKRGPEIFQNDRQLNEVFDQLFRRVAAGQK